MPSVSGWALRHARWVVVRRQPFGCFYALGFGLGFVTDTLGRAS